ncbi:glycoside hydrolase family 9 protein [Ruminococcus albus]|uniref:Glycoside hydrolase family 9 n=1 Tax=Ruminococcus albus (strain ATCC 27210 / DSM 20455 / JCM 14654 / NCDO 2250 / 7) TaxID=697329 RepID=E6UI46_RUMA7|nr:glycoside hydrolase family 9 protein [Ruminococcus albus]ADU21299.1 glycoside hydrolase family 9 [Ruminococcus albus 7 = DSM 20455]
MHKKMKRIVAGLVAITGALSATAASAPMSVFAKNEQIIIQSDFNAGMGLPWRTFENAPARQDFDISDGTYNITIQNNDGPESRWDLQFLYKNFYIQKGHTYKVHWKVNSSNEGELYTRIGNYGGTVEVWHNNCGNDDFNQTWECVKIAKGDNTFDAEFTAKEDMDRACWIFDYGGQGQYQPVDCFPNGTVLKFDDLSLIDTTSGGCIIDFIPNDWGIVRPESNVRLNQIGYYPQLEKRASYVTDADMPLTFEIRDRSGNVKYTGKTKVFGSDPDSGTGKDTVVNSVTRYKDSGANVHIIDFSDFRTVGEYTIFVKDTVGVSGTQVMGSKKVNDTRLSGDKLLWTNPVTMKTYTMNESSTFRIDRQIYDDQLLRDSMNYFYQNRSGVPIKSEYITSGDKSALSHLKYGHNPDMAYVQSKWVKTYEDDFSDGEKDKKIDVTGGWYAASDHGKYVVEGGFSVWTLQNAYEFSKRSGNTRKWTDGTIAVPENKDNAPDILDEARVELEWMFKMINEDGFVYHSVQDYKWADIPIRLGPIYCTDPPMEYTYPYRIVRPPTYAATFNMIACAAQASRLWKGIDDDFAKECLQNAQNSWKAIMAKQSNWNVTSGYYYDDPYFAPSESGGNNFFGDTYVVDDAYWAACELYATTGDSAYYGFLKNYKNYNDPSGQDKAFSLTSCLSGGENNGSFGSFNWGNTAGLGTLSLYLSDKTSSADRKTIVNSIKNIADQYIIQMSKEGMGIPYKSATVGGYIGIGDGDVYTGYEYGSNSFVINNAMVLAYAYDTDNSKYIYRNGAAEALDYLFGRNGLGFSYVSGYGDKAMRSPHHRYWAQSIDPYFPAAPSGVLAGGPCSDLYHDKYLRGLGYKRGTLADQKCYVDSAEAWSVNDVSGSWNAPLVWMSSFMNDRFGGPKPVPYPTNIKVDYSEEYHQVRFTWNKVENADRYGIAVYLAGKWRVQKQDITGTTYTSPKNLTPGVTYKVAIAARVNGTWDTENAIKRACTVTIK